MRIVVLILLFVLFLVSHLSAGELPSADEFDARMAAMDSRGLTQPQIEAGTLGAPARAIGAACAPIEAQVLVPR